MHFLTRHRHRAPSPPSFEVISRHQPTPAYLPLTWRHYRATPKTSHAVVSKFKEGSFSSGAGANSSESGGDVGAVEEWEGFSWSWEEEERGMGEESVGGEEEEDDWRERRWRWRVVNADERDECWRGLRREVRRLEGGRWGDDDDNEKDEGEEWGWGSESEDEEEGNVENVYGDEDDEEFPFRSGPCCWKSCVRMTLEDGDEKRDERSRAPKRLSQPSPQLIGEALTEEEEQMFFKRVRAMMPESQRSIQDEVLRHAASERLECGCRWCDEWKGIMAKVKMRVWWKRKARKLLGRKRR